MSLKKDRVKFFFDSENFGFRNFKTKIVTFEYFGSNRPKAIVPNFRNKNFESKIFTCAFSSSKIFDVKFLGQKIPTPVILTHAPHRDLIRKIFRSEIFWTGAGVGHLKLTSRWKFFINSIRKKFWPVYKNLKMVSKFRIESNQAPVQKGLSGKRNFLFFQRGCKLVLIGREIIATSRPPERRT